MNTLLTFPYAGVLFNTLTVIAGSLLGLCFKKNVPKRLTEAVMCGIGLCTIYIGISGAVSAGSDADANPVMPVIAIALGVVIGTLLDIDGRLARLGDRIEQRISSKKAKELAPMEDSIPAESKGSAAAKGKIAEGFVSACLLFCVGSMTIVGGINAGVSGDNTLYFTKGVLDFVSSTVLSVSFGIGVLLSSSFVLVFQGAIVLAATLIEPLLTTHMIAEMNCVGSLLIVVIGLNLMGITKIKVADYLPAILIALLLATVI